MSQIFKYKLSDKSIVEILMPLQSESLSQEYKSLCMEMDNFLTRLRDLEGNYGQIYARILSLENRVLVTKKK